MQLLTFLFFPTEDVQSFVRRSPNESLEIQFGPGSSCGLVDLHRAGMSFQYLSFRRKPGFQQIGEQYL